MITETPTDPFILGAINAWGDVFAKTVRDDEEQHPPQWRAYKTWRYIPENGLLMWWEAPDEGEQMTVEDWLDRRGYEVHIRSQMGQKIRVRENAIKTLKGTTIRRYKNKVGKQVGSQIYVHRKYANEVIPHDQLRRAAELLKGIKPHFKFNSVMWDMNTGAIRFDESPDFDTAREPHVGKYITILPDGTAREGSSNAIWHHKWLWVKDDYKGFDVDKATEWSRMWLGKVPEIAKGTDASFGAQLQKYGLSEVLMEGSLEKAVEDFLVKTIRGTEWEGKVFVAGGYVRDEFMGKDPKDLDLLVNSPNGGFRFAKWITQKIGAYKGPVTDPPIPPKPEYNVDAKGKPATPQDQAIEDNWLAKLTAIQKLYINPVIFPRFGTVKFNLRGVVHNGIDLSVMDIEAVMPRKEQYIPGSRKPIVTGGELKDDVERRDFTVNSLLKDLSTGEVLDLTGLGKADIRAGIVRTPLSPDKIFTDDPLRMLRAVRFTMKYNWKLPMFMIRGLTKNAAQLQNISQERIRDELNKMLLTGSPDRAIKLLKVTGLLNYVIPELKVAVKMTQNVHHKHDVFTHTLDVLSKTQPELKRRLIALFHDIGKTITRSVTPTGVHFYGHEDSGAKMAEDVMRRLAYPNELIDAVKKGVQNHMRLKGAGDDAVHLSDKTLRKFANEMGEDLEALLDVMDADNKAHSVGSAMPNQITNIRKRLEGLKKVADNKPKLPINGNDIQTELGVRPGPLVGKALAAVTDAWFENPNITREDAMEIARSVTGSP